MVSRTKLLLVVLVALFVGCSNQPPSTAELENAVFNYAQAECAKRKDAKVSKPTKIRLGKYNEQLKGWEVYAQYTISYRENGINFNENVNGHSPAAYAKYSGGNLVCFKPDLFANFESQMEKEFSKAFEGM